MPGGPLEGERPWSRRSLIVANAPPTGPFRIASRDALGIDRQALQRNSSEPQQFSHIVGSQKQITN